MVTDPTLPPNVLAAIDTLCAASPQQIKAALLQIAAAMGHPDRKVHSVGVGVSNPANSD